MCVNNEIVMLLILFAVLCSVVVSDETSTDLPSPDEVEVKTVLATVGGYAVMNCELDFPFGNEIPYHLQWDRDGESVLWWYSGDSGGAVGPRWIGRAARVESPDLGKGSLNLTAVRDTDQGLYRCLVTFPNRSPPARNNGTFYYLEVDGSNLIVMPPMNATVIEGEKIELECRPKTYDATIIWYKNGVLLEDLPELYSRVILSENGTLMITSTVATDAGEYHCQVTADDGQVQTANAFVDVQYKAKIVYAPKEKLFSFGKPASLDCHFNANPPLTNLRWEKDGFLFDPYNVQGVFYSRNGSLLFNKVGLDDAGVYSCTAYNKLGTAGPGPGVRVTVSRPVTLRPAPPLLLARLGTEVTFTCTADDNLTHTLVWSRTDGVPLPAGRYRVSGGNLTLWSVSESDGGQYTCRVVDAVADTADTADTALTTDLLIENVPPRPPYNLTAVPSTQSIHITWTPGTAGGTTEGIEYAVWYREVGGDSYTGSWQNMRILTAGVTEAGLTGLKPNTKYELRVLAQDVLGDGRLSRPLMVTTLDPEVVSIPGHPVSAVTMSSRSLQVSSRALDAGMLVTWPVTGDLCTVLLYLKDHEDPVLTRQTSDHYMLIPAVEEGGQYRARVECGGDVGETSLLVPQYGRLRAVAAGTVLSVLLLATLAAIAYFARHRICPPNAH